MKRFTQIALLVACMLGSMITTAQSGAVKKADKDFESLEYIDARDIYLSVANDGYGSSEVYRRLGDTYYFNADYVEAAKWYGQLMQYQGQFDPEYYFRYAQTLKSLEDYEESDKIMKKFEKSTESDDRSRLFVQEENYLEEIEEQSGRYILQPQAMNSPSSDFAPTYHGKDEVLYASNRSSGLGKKIHEWNEMPFYDLFVAQKTQTETIRGAVKFDKMVNTDYHESTAAFTTDLNTMFFTRNNYSAKNYQTDAEGLNRLKIYKTVKTDSTSIWSDAIELPFSSNEYTIAHPALSKDNKTLYFASDMPGTSGSSDLWMVSIQGDDSYGTPMNLGELVNTDGRDTFPFISDDNRLYFASDGRPGLGGLDIYTVELDGNGMPMGEVINLGEPVNSPYDDFTFIVNSKSKLGFFASNRPGGVGDDDIYGFVQTRDLYVPCKPHVMGQITDMDSGEPIQNATVSLRDMNNEILDQVKTDLNGRYDFGIRDCSKTYLVRGLADGYDTAEKRFETPDQTEDVQVDLVMKNNKITPDAIAVGTDLAKLLNIPIIYFDFDKSFIRQDAEVELQKVIAVMKEYPKLKIDVRSHTDSRATDFYNWKLSNRRNKSTIAYLVNVGGISADRITGQGYGETRHVNRCSNGVPCSEEEHQLNRRSEFIVVSNN